MVPSLGRKGRSNHSSHPSLLLITMVKQKQHESTIEQATPKLQGSACEKQKQHFCREYHCMLFLLQDSNTIEDQNQKKDVSLDLTRILLYYYRMGGDVYHSVRLGQMTIQTTKPDLPLGAFYRPTTSRPNTPASKGRRRPASPQQKQK
jgi:hypothetical protein